jgi:hypothetical protein
MIFNNLLKGFRKALSTWFGYFFYIFSSSPSTNKIYNNNSEKHYKENAPFKVMFVMKIPYRVGLPTVAAQFI